MEPKMRSRKGKARRGRTLLVAGLGVAGVIGLGTACGITGGVHGVAPCEGAECGPFGLFPNGDGGADAGADAGLDAGSDGGADAGNGPFGLFPNPDGGGDAG